MYSAELHALEYRVAVTQGSAEVDFHLIFSVGFCFDELLEILLSRNDSRVAVTWQNGHGHLLGGESRERKHEGHGRNGGRVEHGTYVHENSFVEGLEQQKGNGRHIHDEQKHDQHGNYVGEHGAGESHERNVAEAASYEEVYTDRRREESQRQTDQHKYAEMDGINAEALGQRHKHGSQNKNGGRAVHKRADDEKQNQHKEHEHGGA